MTEFDCEGCGAHVVDLGRVEPPSGRLCAVCEWANEFLDPGEIMETRRRVEPGGWISEREQRSHARRE